MQSRQMGRIHEGKDAVLLGEFQGEICTRSEMAGGKMELSMGKSAQHKHKHSTAQGKAARGKSYQIRFAICTLSLFRMHYSIEILLVSNRPEYRSTIQSPL